MRGLVAHGRATPSWITRCFLRTFCYREAIILKSEGRHDFLFLFLFGCQSYKEGFWIIRRWPEKILLTYGMVQKKVASHDGKAASGLQTSSLLWTSIMGPPNMYPKRLNDYIKFNGGGCWLASTDLIVIPFS